MKKTFTCVVCPIGCELHIEFDPEDIFPEQIKVSGNSCPRGEKYAKSEIVNPERTMTSTVKLNSKILPVLPVKTDKPISKDKIFDAMHIINRLSVSVPVNAGDIICEDFTDKGINLVACRTVSE